MDYLIDILYDELDACETILSVDDIIPIYGEDKVNITLTDAIDAHTYLPISSESAFDDIIEYIRVIFTAEGELAELDLDYEVDDENPNVITIYGTINIL